MDLGAFSVSLAVKDIQASADFYAKLGFEPFGGDIEQHWLILKNGTTVIGLFQGMFEQNTLTFNPGWDADAQEVEAFTDVRALQQQLKAQGVTVLVEADEELERAGELRRARSGRQPHPGRPAPLTPGSRLRAPRTNLGRSLRIRGARRTCRRACRASPGGGRPGTPRGARGPARGS